MNTFYCIGDSHISAFTNQERIYEPKVLIQNENFNIMNVGPRLVYKLVEERRFFLSNPSDTINLILR